jgi:phosphoglycolate phosphatase
MTQPDSQPTRLIVFDLDGTLIDSLHDLAASVNATFLRMRLPLRGISEVRDAIGNGALRLIQELLPENYLYKLDEAHGLFLEHYTANCSEQTVIYEGVLPYLDKLKKIDDLKIGLLTNKPYAPTQKILEKLELTKYFDIVVGGDTLETRKPNPEGLEFIMKTTGRSQAETIMVGDSIPDFEAARRAAVRCIGIQGGFGGKGSSGADFNIEKFADIEKLDLGLKD